MLIKVTQAIAEAIKVEAQESINKALPEDQEGLDKIWMAYQKVQVKHYEALKKLS